MAIVLTSSASSNFGNAITNSPSFASVVVATAGDYIFYAIYVNRQNAITIPPATAPALSNGQSFTLLQNLGENGVTGGALLVYGLKTNSAGTYTITTTYNQFANTSGLYAVYSNTDPTTQIGAIVTQAQWTTAGYVSPSLTVAGATGDLIIEFLGSPGWDDAFTNLSAITWTGGASQTNVIDQNNTAGGSSAFPRIILSTKAGAASVNVTQTKSSGTPAFAHVAFALKASATVGINTLSSPVAVGGTGYTGTTTGMTAITSLNVASKPVTITSASAGSFGFSMPTFVNGFTYPAMGVRTFTAGDGALTYSKTSTLTTLAGYTAVVMGATIDRTAWSLGKDTTIVTGDEIHLPTSAGTLNADSSLTDVVFGTYTMWRRDVSDGTMYTSTLTVTAAGLNALKPHPLWIGIGI